MNGTSWDGVFGNASRPPVVFVDGDGPYAALPGAVALPVAERASAGIALGTALAGRPTLLVVGDAGRTVALSEVLHEAMELGRRGWSLPLVVVVDVDASTGSLSVSPGLLVAALGAVRWSSPQALPEAVAAAWSSGSPTLLLLGGASAEDASAPAVAKGRATALALPTDAEVLRARGDLEVVAWTGLGGLSDWERDALAASLQRTGRAIVVAGASDRALGAFGLSAVVEAGFWWLEEPPVVVEPDQVDKALVGWA